MKKFLLLTRILLKSGLGDFNGKTGKKNKKKFSLKISRKVIYIFIIICFAPLMFSLYKAGSGAYFLLNSIEQEGILINLVCGAGSIMTFVFGMIVVISVYYYTSDIEYLLPLPLKPYHIVGAKFTITLMYEYLSVIVLLLPIFIGYGTASDADFIYWICTAGAVLFMPVAPLVYGSVISMVIMLIFKKAKNKDFIMTISTLLFIGVILGINGFSNTLSGMTPEALNELLIRGDNSLTGSINIIFPNLVLLQKSLVFSDILSLILYICTVVVYIIVFLFIAKLLYFKGVSGISNTYSKRKAISEEQSRKIIKRNNPVKTYIIKELKLLIRTPVYFLNCILISLVWPVLFVIPFLGSIISGSGDSGFDFSMIMEGFDASNSNTAALCILIVFIISIFVPSINLSAGTSISREGKNLFVMKYIPLSYKKQIFAKAMSGILISLFSTTIYCLIAMIILRMPLFAIVVSTILSFLSSFLFNYLSIIVDLIRPKLNWENEQSAIKQNLNTIIEMFISIVFGGILVFLGIKAYLDFNISIYMISFIGCILLIIITFILHKTVLSLGEKRLKVLE